MKNSTDTIGNRTRDPRLNQLRHRVPSLCTERLLIILTKGFFILHINMSRMHHYLVTSPLLHVENKKMMMSVSTPLRTYIGGNRSIAPLIPNHSTRWRPVVGITHRPLYPRVRTPGVSWAPEPLWTFRKRAKPRTPATIPLRTVQLLPTRSKHRPIFPSADWSSGLPISWISSPLPTSALTIPSHSLPSRTTVLCFLIHLPNTCSLQNNLT